MIRLLLAVSMLSAAMAMAQALGPQTPAALSAKFLELMAANQQGQAIALFSEAVQAQQPGPAIEGAWKQLAGGLGAFKKSVEVKQTPLGELVVFNHRLQFERGAIITTVTVNPRTLRLEGFQLTPEPKDFVSADYVKRGAFRAEEVSFGAKDFLLPGTVLVPTGKGPFPAVVLVHGSGPNDRDESVGANKPFRDLAEGLATRGVLVFRYDKRTLVHGAKLAASATIDHEVVDDAVAAAELLRRRPDVDSKRLVVLGHSLGALLAPQIASQAKLTGAVLLAPPARAPWQILPQQYRYLGVPEPEVAAIEKKLLAIRDRKSEEPLLGASAAYWRDWAARDGIAAAKKLTVPLLVMWGARDYQVIAEDFAAWKKGLAGRKQVKFVEVPGANHLFISGSGKPSPAEYQLAGHVAPEVVAAIAAFVAAAP